MAWGHLVALFFGGVFLANFVPHFVSGVTGRPFQTPFATPPFRGLSPPRVNVAYAMFNVVVAYVLLVVVGGVDLGQPVHAAVAGAGFGLAGMGIAGSLGRIQAAAARQENQV